MAQTTMNVRMDAEVKKQFDALCAEFGMNASVAVNIFAKAVVRERKIPFEITAREDPFYSEENQKRLREAMDRLESGQAKLITKTMAELEAMEDA